MFEDQDFDDEVVDIEPYEGPSDWSGPVVDEFGNQDTHIPDKIVSFARPSSPTRDWKETLEWYRNHDTASEIGFDPDGMCLKVCRTARNIPAMYLTAKLAQEATPVKHRFFGVPELRRGMVLYFDDPLDNNKAGHIVTMIGRVKGFDPEELDDVLVVTNSVQADQLTVVRASYFQRVWGDEFQFGATWLNGVELDVPAGGSRLKQFHRQGAPWDIVLLDEAAVDGRHEVGRIRDLIVTQVNRLPDNPKLTRVREFKEEFRHNRVLKMGLLNEAVDEGRTGLVKTIRDEILRLIKTLPEC